MDNQKKKKNDIIENLSFWQRHSPLLSVILVLGSLLIYISIMRNNALNIENESIIYPVLMSPKPIISLGLIFVPVIIFLIMLFLLSSREPSYKCNVISLWSDIITFGLALFLGCGISIYFLGTFLFGESYIHQDRLNLDNQIYMLTSHFLLHDGLNYYTYIIFECDNNGISCSKIFETSRVQNAHDPAELTYDEENQELSIIVNDEVVETVQLE